MSSDDDSITDHLVPDSRGQIGYSPISSRFVQGSPLPSHSFSTPNRDEANHYRMEVNNLRIQLKQLQIDYQAEQDTILKLRKKLNSVEKEKLENATKGNTEVSDLESQLARLRSKLEKGEAVRQNLEFELSRSRREVSQEKQSSADRESILLENYDAQCVKISALTNNLSELHAKLQHDQHSAEEREERLQKELNIKEDQHARRQADREVVAADRDKFMSELQLQKSNSSDLDHKIKEMEGEKTSLVESLRRTVTDLEYGRERDDRMKKDLEMALQRMRAQDENIEGERAAHLETKFNSEIIQLRVRDLEGAVEVEKSAKIGANSAMERMIQQIQELEIAYGHERKGSKDAKEKIERLQKEYSIIQRQLTSEVNDKKEVISSLSKQLDIHQKDFNELKEELTNAKKRQIFLEQTYGGCMSELELIIQSFQLTDENRRKKTKKATNKQLSPSVLLESLRHLLMDYKKQIGSTVEELNKITADSKKLRKECDAHCDMICTKDKSIEESQNRYTKTAKELNRIRTAHGNLESTLAKIKIDLQDSSEYQNQDKRKIQELSIEILKLVKSHKAEDEEKLAFVHSLYQRMGAGRPQGQPRERNASKLSWMDLTSLVMDRLSAMLESLQRGHEQLHHLDSAMKNKDQTEVSMKQAYEDQLNKLTSLTREREISWQKQKEELENHYAQLVNDLQNRSKKTQSIADQAWEKIRVSGNVQQNLEAECSDLHAHIADTMQQNSALLMAVSLLLGAFYPLHARSRQLTAERNRLEETQAIWNNFKERAQILVGALTSEMEQAKEIKPGRNSKRQNRRQPLLLFRIGAIAVMAANRLNYLRCYSAKAFVSQDSMMSHCNLVVHSGNIKQAPSQFQGISSHSSANRSQQAKLGEEQLFDWLTNTELSQKIVTSMSDLRDTVNRVKDSGNPVETRAIVAASRSAFTRIIDVMAPHFTSTSTQSIPSYRERSSLVYDLGRGLARAISDQPLEGRMHLTSSQELITSLQNHVLDFTQRLHSVEIDRHNLLVEMKKGAAELNAIKIEKEKMESDLKSSKQKEDKDSEHQHSADRFDEVCLELNNALHREQKAQQLMHDQSDQLEDLTRRLDMYTSQGIEKEQTLSEAIQGLSEAKMDLRRKDQSLRQLNKQVSSMDSEKKCLTDNLFDAERALRTASKDKEVLVTYIKAVEKALGQAKEQLSATKDLAHYDVSLPKLLLNADLIPADIGKAGQELIACQNLVGAFIDLQHQAHSKIRSYDEEISSYKQVISSLKRELADAVRREYGSERGDHNGFLDAKSSGLLGGGGDDVVTAIQSFKEPTSPPTNLNLKSSLKQDKDNPSAFRSPQKSRSNRLRSNEVKPR